MPVFKGSGARRKFSGLLLALEACLRRPGSISKTLPEYRCDWSPSVSDMLNAALTCPNVAMAILAARDNIRLAEVFSGGKENQYK